MSSFTWSTFLPFIDSSIVAEMGRGVKVALLDSGVDFSHPALSHLKRDGRCFDATKVTLSVDNDFLEGTDNVFDDTHPDSYHGSNLAGIMAGQSQLSGEEYTGIAPEMDMYIFKVSDADGFIFLDAYYRALAYAVKKLDVDIICSAVYPERDFTQGTLNFQSQELTDLLTEITDKNILFFQALRNVNNPLHLRPLSFPASRAASIDVGVMTSPFQQAVIAGHGDDLPSIIEYIIPQFDVGICSKGPSVTTNPLSASQSTAVLSGIASLLLQHKRQQSGDDTARLSREDLHQLLDPSSKPMTGSDVFNNPLQLCIPS